MYGVVPIEEDGGGMKKHYRIDSNSEALDWKRNMGKKEKRERG